MNKKVFYFFILITFAMPLMGCNKRLHFLVCPAELASKMKVEKELGNRREILFNSDYRIVVVEEKDGKIIPVQHYIFKLNNYDVCIEVPYKVSFKEPFTISTILIIDVQKRPLGIAINKKQDTQWRIYWLSKDDFTKAKAEDAGVVFLPPYEKLPIAKQVSDL